MFLNFIIIFGLILSLLSHSQAASFNPIDSSQYTMMSPLHFFQNTEEIKNVSLKVKGTVPSWLSGQLVRNGSGIVENQGKFLNHWFDGFAKLHAFTFIMTPVN